MSKGKTKNLVGQPIFKQIVKMLPREQFDLLVQQCGSDRYYKTFFSWDQLIVMLFGIFSRCDSMGEVCDSMRVLEGKLNYLNMDCSPAKSTAGDALRDRSEELFKLYYFALIAYFRPLLSVSRKKDVSFEEFYAFDSSTFTLFSEVMKGVGRNRKDDGKKKGGLKVHMLTDIHADTAVFATISEAKMHDKKFLAHLNPAKGSMLVFDKAYNFYQQFADWTREGVNFVCRLKDNAKAQLQEVLFEKNLTKEEFGVYKIGHIHLEYKREKKPETLCLRLVYYKDEKGRKYKFITNNWEITPEEVALIYKYRWTIELTFKKLKQNFQLHFFYSETENGIKTQIWCTLIAHLLLNVVRVLSESKKAFSTIAALIRIHLISHLNLTWVVTEGRRAYTKRTKSRNKSPANVQMSLF
ncbi:IS4 family transposase [Petrimonas mucosa]|uniref:Putative transposase n=1 Tax=Petrimonas mucosa TaxID=1642646 RepID=A0A1G4G5R3_9BACT|nr:IS4 family transposase [Petrimonas mucosa]SCM56698.1 putative transposase {ECO:0000313/EMBL:CDN32867,1} [Petrimonas mucosa]